jgi:glycosyltransferase involved in cell wall biosynthesis
MKVLQLIDSLEPGGAERVAVNIANALSKNIDVSYLCVTRAEGLLKETIFKNVNYKFLDKKSATDINAFFDFYKYVKKEKIDIIHAHSSSFFLATFIKIFYRKVAIVWHDHYGNSDFLEERKFKILRFCSAYFGHVFSVNTKLESWAKKKLQVKSISYLPNFAVLNNTESITKLKGEDGKRMVCLANLRPQKNHFTLIKTFELVNKKHPNWSLHLIGKDFNDDYSESIKNLITQLELTNSVFIYGSCMDTFSILKQSSIGLLSSISEGLPIALLEYGLIGLATVTTNVGQCSEVVLNDVNGFVVKPNNITEMAKALGLYIENENLRLQHGIALRTHVETFFSEKFIIEKIKTIYDTLCV